MARILLVNARLQSAVCEHGVGHQLPLGLLMLGGPLRDAGYDVRLIDAAAGHLSDLEITRQADAFDPQLILIAHVGSTQAHPCCLRVLRALKAALPRALTVYGGVHPTYHYAQILRDHPEVDIIVRGEGEATIVELAATLTRNAIEFLPTRLARDPDERGSLPPALDLGAVAGVAWRRVGRVIMNPPRPPIHDLDDYRVAWELVQDWDQYKAFGLGRAAVVQFSRGCPHTCTYCGQWMFWKSWRYRDVVRFVDELERLRREHDIRFFWLADENPTTLKDIWAQLLAEIARRRLDIGLCASIRAQDIVRDADILPLYRAAGFTYVLMGVETVTDENLSRIRKGSSVDDAYRAVGLLREQHILSIVDYMFGIDDESPRTLWRALRGLLRYDGDFVNALYLTPHAWTQLGRELKDAPVVEHDLWKWDYRHQVLAVQHLSPAQLFMAVKLIELVYHLHPRRLWRMLSAPDARLRQQLRFAYIHTSAVYAAEVREFLADHWGVKTKNSE